MEVFGKSNRTQRYCPYLEGIHNSDNILYIFRCNVMWSRIKALCFSHLLLAVLCQQSIQRVLWKWGDGIILKRLTRQACSHRLSYKCVNIQTRMGMQTFVSFCRRLGCIPMVCSLKVLQLWADDAKYTVHVWWFSRNVYIIFPTYSPMMANVEHLQRAIETISQWSWS